MIKITLDKDIIFEYNDITETKSGKFSVAEFVELLQDFAERHELGKLKLKEKNGMTLIYEEEKN